MVASPRYSNTIAAALAALGEDEIIWQPLAMIGVIADLIDDMVEESTTQRQLFTEGLCQAACLGRCHH